MKRNVANGIRQAGWLLIVIVIGLLFASRAWAQDDAQRCQTLTETATSLYQQSRYADALEQFQQAQTCYRAISDRAGEGTALNNIGFVYESLGQYDQALVYYRQSLAILQEIDDRAGASVVLNSMGLIYESLGQYDQALDVYLKSLTILQELDDRAGESLVLNTIGGIYHYLGQSDQALDYYRQSLTIVQELGNRAGEKAVLNNMGAVHDSLGQYEQALDYYRQSLAISRDIKDQAGEATTLNNIGLVYYNKGQDTQALDYYQQALAIRQAIGDQAMVGETLVNIGGVYDRQGQYRQALNYFQQALVIFQQAGQSTSGEREGAALLALGDAYHDLGQYEQALDHYRQALALQQKVGDRRGEGITLSNIGRAYDDLKQYDRALEHYQKALPIQQEVGDRAGEGVTLNNIALAYDNLGQYQSALSRYQESLVIRREVGDQAGEMATLSNIGVVYHNLKQYRRAINYFLQALTIAEAINDQVEKGTILGNIGFAHEMLGNTSQVMTFYEQAIATKESVQTHIQIEELTASYAAEQARTYEHLVNVLWQQARFEEAFDYSERARARVFLNQLSHGVIDFRAGANAQLLAQEQALRAEITIRRAQLIARRSGSGDEQPPETLTELQTEITDLEEEYASLLTRLKIQSPEYASLVSAEVTSLAEVQAELPPNTTLVEYVVTEEHTLAFVITHDDFDAVTLAVSREKLDQAITSFRDFSSLDDPHPAGLQRLYQWLIKPLKPYLTTDTLGIVPHNVLHYLPFAALSDGQRYLNDDYTLFILPSASSLRFVQEKHKPAPTAILALGSPTTTEPLPPLNFARREVERIGDLYGGRALTGRAATETVVRVQANTKGILHLAAHATYNPYNPLFSTIHLAADAENDGRLEVHEIYGLDLTGTTDLVVLSACETVIGELSAGDEVVGLNRAFLYTGTPTVIASLWTVDDETTAMLMERLYTYLQRGRSKAEALRQAQVEVRDYEDISGDHPYQDPYYWAAFVLSGDTGEMGEVGLENKGAGN